MTTLVSYFSKPDNIATIVVNDRRLSTIDATAVLAAAQDINGLAIHLLAFLWYLQINSFKNA